LTVFFFIWNVGCVREAGCAGELGCAGVVGWVSIGAGPTFVGLPIFGVVGAGAMTPVDGAFGRAALML
jgi:hypothetical protein